MNKSIFDENPSVCTSLDDVDTTTTEIIEESVRENDVEIDPNSSWLLTMQERCEHLSALRSSGLGADDYAEEGKDDENDDEEEVESSKENDANPHDIFAFLSHMKDIMSDSDGDDDNDDDMGADDYHNKAVGRACRGKKKEAAEICMDGLRKYPLNVDLLADTIQYSSDVGDMENAARYYAILKEKVPFSRWNWRAFTFAFDYLLETDPVTNEKECRIIVENYKKYLNYEEKACMAESELEAALGNMEKSMEVLQAAIHTHSNASQCALRLADMQMGRGLYDEALATTNYGIAASAEVQPSINIPYLYYIRALAKDHILHKKEYDGEAITKAELDSLVAEYKLLLSEFPELMRHSHTIEMRVKMLKFVKAE